MFFFKYMNNTFSLQPDIISQVRVCETSYGYYSCFKYFTYKMRNIADQDDVQCLFRDVISPSFVKPRDTNFEVNNCPLLGKST